MAVTRSNENYIADDCTEEGYIKADPGLHGALTFTYRPMLPEEQSALAKHIGSMEPKRGVKTQAEAMARKVLSWDLQRDGVELPIEADVMRHLRPMLFSRLYLVLSGLRPSDPLPGEEPANDDKAGELSLDDILGERTQGEAQQKN